MCNLYKLRTTGAEIAHLFDASPSEANVPGLVYPGYPGWIVANGALVSAVWGFPLARTGARGQPLKPKPVNNAREDRLDTFFWRDSFARRRCLIPASAFAEAEGEAGRMTRTWFSLPGVEAFACAGIWRETPEWGAAFSMVMCPASAQIAPMHDRMPVILSPDQHDTWLNASPAEARALCVPFSGSLEIDRSAEPWRAARPPGSGSTAR